ncbi:MAG TPA: PAS domain-containing sensor histidine kinase [Candidatus Thermoplasmatota archaeon]|nr:PAS domain-containing sensor histidine kinase [Candidatus Thermoplasmatota archaeon]
MQATLRRRAFAWLPEGRPLPEAMWATRHRIVLALLWLHVPAILAFGAAMGQRLLHVALETVLVAAFAAAASVSFRLPERHQQRLRSIRATLAGGGLIASSAILTHLSGGYVELHFHFFVMIAVMAMYQDWTPFLMAIGFVAIHHGLVGALDPASVYNHPDALAHPWKWAGIHAGFMLAASVAAVVGWRYSEQARFEAERALQQSRASLSMHQATLESTPDAVVVVGRDGRITSYNHQFAAMWGVPERVLKAGDTQAALAAATPKVRDAQAFLRRIQDLQDKPEAESHDLIELRDGRALERFSRPQRLDGQVLGRVWCFRDVTERRRAEEDRVLAAERLAEIRQLKEADRFRSHLLNTASHELNTPLTPLRLQVHLLQACKHQLDPQGRRAVEILDRNLQRLSGLVQNVLDVGRIEADRLRLRVQDVDMAAVAAHTVQSFEEAARLRGIHLEHLEDAPLPSVRCDEDRVIQVLFNLVSNALKFTPEGGHVKVHTQAVAHGVRVEVTDTGRGLAPHEVARLFAPFSQAHEDGGPAGSGLGLFICRGIAERHGGSVGVTSRGLGQGCTFWLELPFEAPAPPAEAEPALEAAREPDAGAPSAPGAEDASAWHTARPAPLAGTPAAMRHGPDAGPSPAALAAADVTG